MRLVVAFAVALIGTAAACSAQVDPARAVSQGVTAARPVYELGQTVVLTYAIRNESRTAVTFDFRSAKQFDIWVLRGDEEIFRASAGRRYAQAATHLALRPGEGRTFCVEWDQKDARGKQVGPGAYALYGKLTPSGRGLPATTGKVRLGVGSAAMVPLSVSQAVAEAARLADRKVTIVGAYRGSSPYPNDPNTKAGPPVDASDWAICDPTGCMYVHGRVTLKAAQDIGTAITAVGKIAVTDKGQVYLNLESASTSKGSVYPPGGG